MEISFFLTFLLVPLVATRSLPTYKALPDKSESNGLLRRYNDASVAHFYGTHLNNTLERRQHKRHVAAIETVTTEHGKTQAWVPPLNESLDPHLSTNINARYARQSTELVARQEDSIGKCLRNFGVQTFYSWDPARPEHSTDFFDYMKDIFNNAFPGAPKVVVIASTIKEVQWAVLCAAAARLPVQARAGGHSWAGYSSGYDGNKQRHMGDTVIIDIQALDSIEYDKRDQVVTVGGGVLLGNLAVALLANERAISHGDCPSVGVAGHVLHGGRGKTSRMWGTSTDFITELTIVNAQGQVQELSETKNSELFWAMKGAGSSFAVAVSLKLRTVPVPKQVISFESTKYYLDSATATHIFFEIQRCVLSSEVNRYLNLDLLARASPSAQRPLVTLWLRGHYFGFEGSEGSERPVSYVQRVLRPCFREAMGGTDMKFNVMDYKGFLTRQAGSDPLEKPESGYTRSINEYEKITSITLPARSPPSEAMMRSFFSALALTPPGVGAGFMLVGGTDSRLPLQTESNALSWCNSLWAAWFLTSNEGLKVDIDKLRRKLVYTTGEQTNYGLTTFIDGNLQRDEAQKIYFSSKKLARLREIKAANDPGNVFRNPQSIEPQP